MSGAAQVTPPFLKPSGTFQAHAFPVSLYWERAFFTFPSSNAGQAVLTMLCCLPPPWIYYIYTVSLGILLVS